MRHLRAKRNNGNLYDQDFKAISVAYRTLLVTTLLVGFVDLVFFSLDGTSISQELSSHCYYHSRVLFSHSGRLIYHSLRSSDRSQLC